MSLDRGTSFLCLMGRLLHPRCRPRPSGPDISAENQNDKPPQDPRDPPVPTATQTTSWEEESQTRLAAVNYSFIARRVPQETGRRRPWLPRAQMLPFLSSRSENPSEH